MSTKTYKLPLARNYVCGWTASDGIREVVQNALDGGPLKCNWWRSATREWTLSITSVDVQLPPSLLLLGSSSKEGGDSSRGEYGEGFKLAFLTLVREGLDVVCYNGDRMWVPYFDTCQDFDAEMLHICDADGVGGGKDLVYQISGISDELKEEVISNTLAMQTGLDMTETSYGRILKDPEHKGKVYVGGLFVCRANGTFGYDFNPEVMPLNRDRKQLDTWDMKREIGKMHCEKTPAAEVAAMVESQTADLNYLQYHTHVVPEEVIEEVFKLHIKINGDVPLADNHTESKSMKKEGYTDALYLGNDGMTALVKMSPNYNPQPKEEVVTPHETMLKWMKKWGDELSGDAYEELSEITEESKEWQ